MNTNKNRKTLKIFSKRIKKLRLKYNLTQKELGEKLDITYSAIGTYERGIRLPRTPRLKKISEYFNVSSDYLLGKTENQKPVDDIIKTITNNTELYDLWLKVIENKTYVEILKEIDQLNKKQIKQVIEILRTFEKNK